MKRILILTLALVLLLGLIAAPVMAGKPENGDKKADCTTIQDGTLLASDGTVITTGYDQWGYNYQAHLFNGGYCDSYRDADWCQPYKDIKLMMKWNDAWLSNKDCDGDLFLDRHYGFETYIGSGAWLTNHQSGSYTIVDELNIGDLESEAGHNLEGWSDPWTWGGNYGGGDDGTLRLLMGPGDGCGHDSRDAYFAMDTHETIADKLILRHLDGSQDDDFDVYILDGEEYTPIGSYEAEGGGENWVTTEFAFSPRSGEIAFKLVATGTAWALCGTYGQVAFSWAQLESTSIYKWNYFVKIVAAPADANAVGGIWYASDGTEIGEVIWGSFAVIQSVYNDQGTGEHGIEYLSPVGPGLGKW